MNDKIYNLIIKILESDLPKETKDEIVRFYTLPRNTPIKPIVEIPDEKQEELGSLKRPTAHDRSRIDNPQMAASEDEMSRTLKGRVK